jgi:hypothetical protein
MIYDKIELLVKNYTNGVSLPSTTKIPISNCGYEIKGDYLIIIETIQTQTEDTTTHRIFNMMDVSAFKTYIYK